MLLLPTCLLILLTLSLSDNSPANFVDFEDGFRYAVMDGTAKEVSHDQCDEDPGCSVCQPEAIELLSGWSIAPYSYDVVNSVVEGKLSEEQIAEGLEAEPTWGTFYVVLSNNIAYSTAGEHFFTR